jgi:hypothetical protein
MRILKTSRPREWRSDTNNALGEQHAAGLQKRLSARANEPAVRSHASNLPAPPVAGRTVSRVPEVPAPRTGSPWVRFSEPVAAVGNEGRTPPGRAGFAFLVSS